MDYFLWLRMCESWSCRQFWITQLLQKYLQVRFYFFWEILCCKNNSLNIKNNLLSCPLASCNLLLWGWFSHQHSRPIAVVHPGFFQWTSPRKAQLQGEKTSTQGAGNSCGNRGIPVADSCVFFFGWRETQRFSSCVVSHVFLFSPLFGEDFSIWRIFFKWFWNHQLTKFFFWGARYGCFFFLRGVLYVFCSCMQVSFNPGTLLISCKSFGSCNLQPKRLEWVFEAVAGILSPQKLWDTKPCKQLFGYRVFCSLSRRAFG